jgi:hypothetical protein
LETQDYKGIRVILDLMVSLAPKDHKVRKDHKDHLGLDHKVHKETLV